jgi:hypothetical protein
MGATEDGYVVRKEPRRCIHTSLRYPLSPILSIGGNRRVRKRDEQGRGNREGRVRDSDISISVNLGSILLTGATEGGKKRYGGKKEP